MEELEFVLVHMIAEPNKLGEKNRDLSGYLMYTMLERWVLDAVGVRTVKIIGKKLLRRRI